MRKFVMSAMLALVLACSVSVGPADAQLFRRRYWGGYYGYPSYYYGNPGYGYGRGFFGRGYYSPGYYGGYGYAPYSYYW